MPDDLVARVRTLTQGIVDDAAADRAVRVGLLHIHAGMKVALGVLILFTGGLHSLETALGIWTRPLLGGWALLGGLVLAASLARRNRRCLLGLLLIGVWDLAFTGAILVSLVVTGAAWSWPWTHADPITPRPYVAVIYVGLALMIWGVHIPAALRIRRQGDQ